MAVPVPPDRRALFNRDYVCFNDAAGTVSVVETDVGGATTVDFAVAAPSILVRGKARQSLYWLKSQSCADGAIVVVCPDGLHVHLIELKKTIGADKWTTIKTQLAGMLANVRGALGTMGLGEPIRLTCHVAYETDLFATAPVLTKAINTAAGITPLAGSDWSIGAISVLDHVDVPLNKIVWGSAATAIGCP